MNWIGGFWIGCGLVGLLYALWRMFRVERRAADLLAECGRLLEQVQSHAPPCSRAQMREFLDDLVAAEAHLSAYINPQSDCGWLRISTCCEEFAERIGLEWESATLRDSRELNRLRAEKAAEAKEG